VSPPRFLYHQNDWADHYNLSFSRQAAAELASIFKSLENRYKKGLLNENEKVRYAEMCAEKEKARRMGMGSKEGECVIA
jgi:hypothetical protein